MCGRWRGKNWQARRTSTRGNCGCLKYLMVNFRDFLVRRFPILAVVSSPSDAILFLFCFCVDPLRVLTRVCSGLVHNAVDSTEAPTFETPLEAMWEQIPEDHTVNFLEVL